MDKQLRDQVCARAGNRCEYCRIHQDHDSFYTFPVDHVIALQHGGKTVLENLALSCLRCNSHKGPNIASIEPATGAIVRLYHPRQDIWSDHFRWSGAILVGRTPIGRSTVELLAVNRPEYVLLRESLVSEGLDLPDL